MLHSYLHAQFICVVRIDIDGQSNWSVPCTTYTLAYTQPINATPALMQIAEIMQCHQHLEKKLWNQCTHMHLCILTHMILHFFSKWLLFVLNRSFVCNCITCVWCMLSICRAIAQSERARENTQNYRQVYKQVWIWIYSIRLNFEREKNLCASKVAEISLRFDFTFFIRVHSTLVISRHTKKRTK